AQIATAFEWLDIGDRKIDWPLLRLYLLPAGSDFPQLEAIKPIAVQIRLKDRTLPLTELRQPQHRLEAGILRQDLVRECGEFPAVDVMGGRHEGLDGGERIDMAFYNALECGAVIGD